MIDRIGRRRTRRSPATVRAKDRGDCAKKRFYRSCWCGATVARCWLVRNTAAAPREGVILSEVCTARRAFSPHKAGHRRPVARRPLAAPAQKSSGKREKSASQQSFGAGLRAHSPRTELCDHLRAQDPTISALSRSGAGVGVAHSRPPFVGSSLSALGTRQE